MRMHLHKGRLTKTSIWVGVLIVMALTLTLYQNPSLMIQMSDLIWSCVG